MSTNETHDEIIPEADLDDSESKPRYISTTPYYTIAILVAIGLVFAIELLLPINVVRMGVGLEKVRFSADNEYWRLLTAAVVHDGFIHVLFNGYALFVLGKMTETISNRANVSIVFLLAAIAGGLLSFAFIPIGNSVGASGGVVGLLGYLTAYGYKRRHLLTNALLKNMLFNIAFIGFIGVFIIPNVDNFGHLGGLIAGIGYGLIQIPSDLYKDPREAGPALKYAGLATLGIVLLTALGTSVILAGFYLSVYN